MAGQHASASARYAHLDSLPRAEGPDKLDRLRLLRATIDSLRSEREAEDPLLAWILNREKPEAF
jgi:hypothetical protein